MKTAGCDRGNGRIVWPYNQSSERGLLLSPSSTPTSIARLKDSPSHSSGMTYDISVGVGVYMHSLYFTADSESNPAGLFVPYVSLTMTNRHPLSACQFGKVVVRKKTHLPLYIQVSAWGLMDLSHCSQIYTQADIHHAFIQPNACSRNDRSRSSLHQTRIRLGLNEECPITLDRRTTYVSSSALYEIHRYQWLMTHRMDELVHLAQQRGEAFLADPRSARSNWTAIQQREETVYNEAVEDCLIRPPRGGWESLSEGAYCLSLRISGAGVLMKQLCVVEGPFNRQSDLRKRPKPEKGVRRMGRLGDGSVVVW